MSDGCMENWNKLEACAWCWKVAGCVPYPVPVALCCWEWQRRDLLCAGFRVWEAQEWFGVVLPI